MNKIEELKKKIDKILCETPDAIKLNPVLPIEQVRIFEETYQITLPEAYVQFITQIGDGGIMPNFTEVCNEINSLGDFKEKGYPPLRINRPFKLEHGFITEDGDPITEDDSSFSEEEFEALFEVMYEELGDGGLSLTSDDTCVLGEWFLIVTGPRKGEVWLHTEYGVMRTDCDVIKWLELHLDNKLEDYVGEFRSRELAPMPTPVEQCRKEFKRVRVKLNPPISMEQVQAFEQRHKIKLPSEYVQLITEVGDGAAKLPWYITKIYSLMDHDCLDDLAQPFFFQTQADIEKYLEQERCGKRIPIIFKDSAPVWSHLFDCPPDTATKGVWRRPQFQMLHGCIPLLLKEHQKKFGLKMNQYILILNGAFAGEVWSLSDRTIYHGHFVENYAVNAFTYIDKIILNAY